MSIHRKLAEKFRYGKLRKIILKSRIYGDSHKEKRPDKMGPKYGRWKAKHRA